MAEAYGTGLKKITEDNKEEKLKVPQENLSKKTHSDTDIREILNNENKELTNTAYALYPKSTNAKAVEGIDNNDSSRIILY